MAPYADMREPPAASTRRKVQKSDDAMPTLKQIAMRLETAEASRALVDQCLERIKDAAGEGPRTFLKVYGEDARMAADAYDALRRHGAAPSLFAGIPVSVKDLFDVAGDVTTAGSIALRHAPPATRDATAIARLRAAGFIPIGRTNMTEFAFSGLGINPHYGTPLNPHDRAAARIPGGSSSGAAVSDSSRPRTVFRPRARFRSRRRSTRSGRWRRRSLAAPCSMRFSRVSRRPIFRP